MKLSTYLAKHDLSLAAFAERIGMSAASVCRMTKGQQIPPVGKLLKIQKLTGGEVRLIDWAA